MPMTDPRMELRTAEEEAELSRSELESSLRKLETRVLRAAKSFQRITSYGKEADRLTREYPLASLAVFLTTGFILGKTLKRHD